MNNSTIHVNDNLYEAVSAPGWACTGCAFFTENHKERIDCEKVYYGFRCSPGLRADERNVIWIKKEKSETNVEVKELLEDALSSLILCSRFVEGLHRKQYINSVIDGINKLLEGEPK